MSNEELLARIDERLKATNENLDKIYTHTSSIDERLRVVELDLKLIQSEAKKIPSMESQIFELSDWKNKLAGSWKAAIVISIVFSFLVNAVISYFKGD